MESQHRLHVDNPYKSSSDSDLYNIESELSVSHHTNDPLECDTLSEGCRDDLCNFYDFPPDFSETEPFYGLPVMIKELIQQYKGIAKLYDWQDECLNLDAVKMRKNLVLALPTSGGKTLVSEILIFKEILCRKRNVLFVLPFVSIVQEKVGALSPFALALDFLVEEYAASKGSYPPRKRRHKRSVYIATVEKALGLVNSLMELDRLPEIGLVVIDELHLIGEASRGIVLETLLTKLIYTKQNIHVVGMSATIGNLPEVCQFLNAEVYTKDFRPVELKEYIKCGNQICEINRHAKCQEDCLVPVRTIDFQYSEEVSKLDPDRLGGLVMEVIPALSCLVFCASKKNCENVATLLCRIIFKTLLKHKRREKKMLLQSLSAEGTLCPILRHTVPFGVAYHHSGLTSEERRLIEDAFRADTLCTICCTSTLAAGVNLPARRVILRSPYMGRDFIDLAHYKQMSGRVGLGEIGESILLCDREDLERVTKLLCSPMESVESQLLQDDARGLRGLVLSCIGLGVAVTRRSLRNVVGCTLLAVQQERTGNSVTGATDQAIGDLFKLGALQLAEDAAVIALAKSTLVNRSPGAHETLGARVMKAAEKTQIVIRNDAKLVISKLGKAAIKGGLDLDTAHLLYEDLVQAQASLVLFNYLHLLYLVTPYDLANQMQPSLPNYYSIYKELGLKELQTARILGLNETCAAGMMTGRRIKIHTHHYRMMMMMMTLINVFLFCLQSVDERVLNRFYLTLILHDLWNGRKVSEVAERYDVSRGIVQQVTVATATFAANVVRFCEQLDEFWLFVDLLRGLSQRLLCCSMQELEPLMQLPGVKQRRARHLYRAGYKTLQSVARANPADLMTLVKHLSQVDANQLIASAKLLLLERVENLREEAENSTK